MSDGNFNRALLPATPYRSGFTMGRKQGIQAARKTMEQVLRAHLPHLSEDTIQLLLESFDKEVK